MRKNNNPNISISVLMPVYNAEKYVEDAIQSILNQTYSDFELIVLDDCSTDNTAEIVKCFEDKRIMYHKNETNLGLSNNLNVGLKLAKGKYIARMDDDDISLPERFQTQIDFLDEHPDIDLCSCGLEMFGMENTVWIREADPEDVKITMLFYSPVLHATSIWRKDSFEKYGLYYDQNAFPAEDYDLWARAVFYCKLANIPQVLYKYRIHGAQVTKTDERAVLKNRYIRLNYIEKALPSLRKDYVNMFVELFNVKNELKGEDFEKLKTIYKSIVLANKKDQFFNQSLLSRRLKKYYQSLIFEYLINAGFSFKNIPLLLNLRMKLWLKLIYFQFKV